MTAANDVKDGRTEDFGYDLVGNRETFNTRSGTVLSYENNLANEYTGIGEQPPLTDVLHDEAGNLISDEDGYGYAYDYQNRLTLVFYDVDADGTHDGGEATLAEYTYDALGRRVEYVDHVADGGPVTTRYRWDGQNVVAEFNDSATPALLRYYVHGSTFVDERAVIHDMVEDLEYYYTLADLYTVDGLVNNRAAEVEKYSYDAYGKPVITTFLEGNVNHDDAIDPADVGLVKYFYGADPCTQDGASPILDVNGDGSISPPDVGLIRYFYSEHAFVEDDSERSVDNPYLFTGRRVDILHLGNMYHLLLQDNRNRTYDSEHGRWMQRDPIGYADGMNLYEYVGAAPTLNFDPFGIEGHHYVVKEIWNPFKDQLSKGVKEVFDTRTPLPHHCGFTHEHMAYNTAVKEDFARHLRTIGKSHVTELTEEEAKQFLHKIRSSTKPAIRKFLDSGGDKYLGRPLDKAVRPKWKPSSPHSEVKLKAAGPKAKPCSPPPRGNFGSAKGGALLVVLTTTSVAMAPEIEYSPFARFRASECIICLCQHTLITRTEPPWYDLFNTSSLEWHDGPWRDLGRMMVRECTERQWTDPARNDQWYFEGSSLGYNVYYAEHYHCKPSDEDMHTRRR